LNSKNLFSAEKNKLDTLNNLQKEVELGRMLGPFNHKPISTLRIIDTQKLYFKSIEITIL
jgi:hypothetical protein